MPLPLLRVLTRVLKCGLIIKGNDPCCEHGLYGFDSRRSPQFIVQVAYMVKARVRKTREEGSNPTGLPISKVLNERDDRTR